MQVNWAASNTILFPLWGLVYWFLLLIFLNLPKGIAYILLISYWLSLTLLQKVEVTESIHQLSTLQWVYFAG